MQYYDTNCNISISTIVSTSVVLADNSPFPQQQQEHQNQQQRQHLQQQHHQQFYLQDQSTVPAHQHQFATATATATATHMAYNSQEFNTMPLAETSVTQLSSSPVSQSSFSSNATTFMTSPNVGYQDDEATAGGHYTYPGHYFPTGLFAGAMSTLDSQPQNACPGVTDSFYHDESGHVANTGTSSNYDSYQHGDFLASDNDFGNAFINSCEPDWLHAADHNTDTASACVFSPNNSFRGVSPTSSNNWYRYENQPSSLPHTTNDNFLTCSSTAGTDENFSSNLCAASWAGERSRQEKDKWDQTFLERNASQYVMTSATTSKLETAQHTEAKALEGTTHAWDGMNKFQVSCPVDQRLHGWPSSGKHEKLVEDADKTDEGGPSRCFGPEVKEREHQFLDGPTSVSTRGTGNKEVQKGYPPPFAYHAHGHDSHSSLSFRRDSSAPARQQTESFLLDPQYQTVNSEPVKRQTLQGESYRLNHQDPSDESVYDASCLHPGQSHSRGERHQPVSHQMRACPAATSTHTHPPPDLPLPPNVATFLPDPCTDSHNKTSTTGASDEERHQVHSWVNSADFSQHKPGTGSAVEHVRCDLAPAPLLSTGEDSNTSSQDERSLGSTTTPLPVVDVDHLLASGVTVAGFKPRPIIRKRRKVTVPPTQKDTGYWQKRKKNNDSAKRSREAKKEKEKTFYRRALELECENYFLKERLGQVEAHLQAVTGVAPTPHDYFTSTS